MKYITKMCLSVPASAFAIALGVHAAEIIVVNFGGTNGDAQKAAFSKPFEAQTGNKVTAVKYNGEQAKIKAMVEAKHVNWNVAEMEPGDIGRDHDEGLLEKLDWSKIAKEADLILEAPRTRGVSFFAWSITLVYNADKFKAAPKGWTDFWDVETSLGERGMRKGACYSLESALMTDGVPARDAYKVLATKDGQNRALKKLDQLKPNIQWWEAGAQPLQFLMAGDVVMPIASNGRIDATQREDRNLRVVWSGSIYDLDCWAIPKGSFNKALAEQYIVYMPSQKPQQEYVKHVACGPASVVAIRALDVKTQANIPNSSESSKDAVLQNLQFWTDHGDKLEQRFASWVPKQVYNGVTQ